MEEVVIEGEPPIHYDAVVSLRIATQTIEPAAITAALGLEPDTIHHLGDTTRRLRDGRIMPRKTAPENFWAKCLVNFTCPPDELPLELGKLLDQLEHASFFFDSVRKDGGRLEFFIGYFMRNGNTGDVFTPPLMARLAQFGIGLSFDIYETTSEG